MKLKVLSALPVLGHPRDSKRIDMILDGGFEVSVVAFNRDYHNSRNPRCEIKILGNIEHGKYISRIFKMVKAIPLFRREIKKNDIVYASGSDMALLAYLSGIGLKTKIILEVGDIRRIQIEKGINGKIMRLFDKFIVSKSVLIVATTETFVNGYYNKWLGVKTNSLIIENKLEKRIDLEPKNEATSNSRVRIGYFGVLRCEWSWNVLKELALANKNRIEIVIAGISMIKDDITLAATNNDNIRFLGNYNSPQDLPKLYAGVDLVWGCYPSPLEKDIKWKWAQQICRSNRFYESCNFKKPIISMEGSGDAVVVENYNIGKIVTDDDSEIIVDVISSISHEEISAWKENMWNLPEEIYIYTNEKEQLKKEIHKILKKR